MERPDYYGNPAGITEDIDVVRAIYAAFARRDVDGALPYLDPDCVLDMRNTAAAAGRTEPYRGHAGARRYFADASAVWDDLVLHADDFRALPGTVIVLGHATGSRQGEPVRRAVVWTWQVRAGKAVSVRSADVGELREA